MSTIDIMLLYELQSFFGVGNVSTHGNYSRFTITSLVDIINVLIPHFNAYPLLTQKGADFYLFSLAANIVSSGLHLTLSGLQSIINIRASLN
ncbi:MAG: hypothetical protein EOP45_15250 [Sphingobacteriaceae bacterium]|nr:MAG: hypothetical protein EOP45_15250 [Sphingobacteriaceae bacterium]